MIFALSYDYYYENKNFKSDFDEYLYKSLNNPDYFIYNGYVLSRENIYGEQFLIFHELVKSTFRLIGKAKALGFDILFHFYLDRNPSYEEKIFDPENKSEYYKNSEVIAQVSDKLNTLRVHLSSYQWDPESFVSSEDNRVSISNIGDYRTFMRKQTCESLANKILMGVHNVDIRNKFGGYYVELIDFLKYKEDLSN